METQKNTAAPNNHQVRLEPGEHVTTVIHRHIFGLVGIYLQAIAALAAVILLAGLIGIDLFRGLSGEASLMLAGIGFLLVLLTVLMLLAVTSMYWQTKLLVTNKGLIQVLQHGLFNRKISRLGMSDIEDVTTEQKGLLATLFNYGTLHIETSGELRNFAFKYTPNPNRYASQIMDARHGSADPGHD